MFTTLLLGAFFARAQLLAPTYQPGIYPLGGTAILDLTRDGMPDLFFPTAFGITLAVQLDENGRQIASGIQGWLPFPAQGNVPIQIAAGAADFNGDGRDDVAMVTNSGAVVIGTNLGRHQVNGQVLATPFNVVDVFGTSMVINPPFVNFAVPSLKVDDIDGDQIPDLLFGVSPVDSWAGLTNPGILAFYRGMGSGNFQKYTIPTSGNVIDVKWADLNSDGVKDTIVYVTETGSVGAFGYDLHHARFDTTNLLHEINFPANLFGRVTSFDVANAAGSPDADYIFGITHPGGGGFSEVQIYEGDGLGNMGNWWPMYFPAPTTAIPAQILSVAMSDLNGDGYPDLAVLRSYVQPSGPGSSAPAQHADAEVHVFYGPTLQFAAPDSTTLNGYIQDMWSVTYVAQFLPMRAMPELLRIVDIGGDGVKDVMVTNLFGTATGSTNLVPQMALMKNPALPPLGTPGMIRFGDPSGPAPDNHARAGFDGRAVLGNSNFKGTISDTAPNSLAGYMWGPYGQANLFSSYGFDFHIAPTLFGYMKITDSTGFATYNLAIPNNPNLIGDVGYFQWNHYNPATGQFGGTQAHQLFVGQ